MRARRREVVRSMVVAAAGAWAGPATVAAPRPPTVVDDRGHTLHLDRPARRVVSLAPNLTEIVCEVGGLDRLVGLDRASDHPPPVLGIPRVADHAGLDVERVMALQPDLVLAWHRGSARRDLAQVEALGVPVAAFEARTIDDVPRIAARIAALLGDPSAAEPLAMRWRVERDRLQQAHAGLAPVRVFYQVWPQPLLTIGADHLIAQAIVLCGGRSLFPTLSGLAPAVSVEAVAAARPELIVTAIDGAGRPPMRGPSQPQFAAWQRLASIPAVRHGLLYVLDGDLISRPGPRWLQGVAQLGEVIADARRLLAR